MISKKTPSPPLQNIERIPDQPQANKKILDNSSYLNPALQFENFVTGKENQLAHAAAYQVAASPGTSYNPLFIYGGVGLGKTHLIQSIGNRYKKENQNAKI